jgi:hypothetical protein
MICSIPRITRRHAALIAGFLAIASVGVVFGWNPATSWLRRRSRRAWLVREEAEIRRQMQAGRPAPTRTGAENWISDSAALFDQGWVVWRLHSSHWDEDQGGWFPIGDLTILVDDQGRKSYSRLHFCDGTLRWGLGPVEYTWPQPKDRDAFLALFPPGTWTDDRSAVEAAIPRARSGP